MNYTDKDPSNILAEIAASINIENVPNATLENAKLRILDYLISAVAGYRVNKPMNEVIVSTLRDFGGNAQSTVLFGGGKQSAHDAAFINAFYGHGADIDDGHRLASGHPGTCVIPAVLALSEARGSTPSDVLSAIIAGYEVYVRLSSSVMPSHVQRGFHGTGTIGTVACAAAVARLLGFSTEDTRKAISLGAVTASGLFEVSESAQGIKPINPGNAARNGIIMALLVENGAEAPEAPFSGKKGFFKAFADEVRIEDIVGDIGSGYKIDECYIKLYPACRHLHGLVDCAAKHNQDGVKATDITKINLYIYPNSIAVTGGISEPKDEGEAKFSMKYATAVSIVSGTYNLADLRNAAQMDDEIRTLIRKMEIISVPELEIREKRIRGARVEVIMKDSKVTSYGLDQPKGDPEQPVTIRDIRQKFIDCAEGMYNKKAIESIMNTAMQFEKCQDITKWLEQF